MPLDPVCRRVRISAKASPAPKMLNVSICAVLLAEACNISLAEVANPGIPALAPNRLSWVSQNHVRAEMIAAANELLLGLPVVTE